MILETSVQARFLIPMAVSLGFGVMFATFVTLLVVPAAFLALDDWVICGWRGFIGAWKELLGKSDSSEEMPRANMQPPYDD